jgi:protein-disulfide isomerase
VRDTYPQIEKEYIETGKLRYSTLDLPLESIHKLAFKAAMATECARDQGKFWEMHDRLFENQRALEPWSAHAEATGLDVAAFDDCMSSEKYADAVRQDMGEAQKAGATGTPSFVLAKTNPDDPSKVTGISFIRGAQAFNAFKVAIDGALGAE